MMQIAEGRPMTDETPLPPDPPIPPGLQKFAEATKKLALLRAKIARLQTAYTNLGKLSVVLWMLHAEKMSAPTVMPDFSPNWLTSTVTALARQMYESRDFSAMPILADALQDAGCDNEDILNHCRESRQHLCRCWVVDGCLKEHTFQVVVDSSASRSPFPFL
ncbi:MAG TPA: hypothetical protein VG122_07260 [Gemmata sp.]|jgi:hypothetical protein|nr:hypothetical protein [Gemmata sp.]